MVPPVTDPQRELSAMCRLLLPLVATVCLTSLIVSQALIAQEPSSNEPDAKSHNIEITDSKLSSINYGIESLEHWIGKLQPGDSRRASTLLRDHEKIVTRFSRIPARTDDQYIFVTNRLAAAKEAIEKKLIGPMNSVVAASPKTTNKPHRDLLSIAARMSALEQDAQRYGDDNPKQRSRIKADLETIKAAFQRVPKSSHGDYLVLHKRITEFDKVLNPSAAELSMTQDQVTAYLNSIQKKYREEVTIPQAREIMKNRELTAEDVDTFVNKIKTFGEHADRDLPKLKQIFAATGQGKYWVDWIESNALTNLQREMKAVKARVDQDINFGLSNAKNRSELDLKKNNYAFNNQSMHEKNEELFSRTLRTIEQAARLEKLLELPATWSPKRSEMQDYIATYRVKVAAASQARDLPAEVGTPEQHQIATEAFKKEKYGVGNIVKQIVNSKTMPRDRIEHKAFNGTLETIVRKWEEFQVTTVEEENGKYYVYRNNLAKFSRAPSTTPINTWILKQRFKSGEIDKSRL